MIEKKFVLVLFFPYKKQAKISIIGQLFAFEKYGSGAEKESFFHSSRPEKYSVCRLGKKHY